MYALTSVKNVEKRLITTWIEENTPCMSSGSDITSPLLQRSRGSRSFLVLKKGSFLRCLGAGALTLHRAIRVELALVVGCVALAVGLMEGGCYPPVAIERLQRHCSAKTAGSIMGELNIGEDV